MSVKMSLIALPHDDPPHGLSLAHNLCRYYKAFDCFSPGSYISSRRQSVDLAGYVHSPVSPDGVTAYIHGEGVISPPLSPTSPAGRSSHARAYSQAAGLPFAALVRRLSYTSSRLPARYSNKHLANTAQHKRPKTSSGPLVSSSSGDNASAFFAFKECRDGDATPVNSTPIGPLSAQSRASQPHPTPTSTPTPTRPHARRRSKSGDLIAASPKSSLRAKQKGHIRRPNYPLRSISFMDEMLPKSSSAGDKRKQGSASMHGPTAVLAPKDPNVMTAVPLAQPEDQAKFGHDAPMTPDHIIEAQLAKHDAKRLSMPNLPTPPLNLPSQTRYSPVDERRMSFDASRRGSSPASGAAFTTHSPALHVAEAVPTAPRAKSGLASPGWPWHRKNSNSSFTNLLSPKLGRQASPASSPSLSPSVGATTIGIPTSPSVLPPTNDPAFLRLDKTPSPNLPLRASPLSQQSTGDADTEPHRQHAVRRDDFRSPKARPGSSKRSLSTSFIVLGRKVASLGNSQAFDGPSDTSIPISGDASLSSSPASGTAAVLTSPDVRGKGLLPSKHKKEWPWRSHSSPPSRDLVSLPASPASGYIPPSLHTEGPSILPPSPLVAPDLYGNTATSDLPGTPSKLLQSISGTDSFLSPASAANQLADRSFVVTSRPQLYRNSKSDDGGLATRSRDPPVPELTDQQLSVSAPGLVPDSSYLTSGKRSPARQASPSPSRNLTKIPETDEQDMQSRRESWLASLRGRPVASKRRMSAADVFRLPSPIRPVRGIGEAGLPLSSATGMAFEQQVAENLQSGLANGGDDGLPELDFTKKPVITENANGNLSFSSANSRAPLDASSAQAASRTLRSRAVSQSSLLSASRPSTPSNRSSSSTNVAQIHPFNAIRPSASPIISAQATALLQGQLHRHTQSMPVLPRLDPLSLEVSGLGAPESSVLAASQAKFARVLSAGAQPSSLPTPASTPVTTSKLRTGPVEEQKEKTRQVRADQNGFEHAVHGGYLNQQTRVNPTVTSTEVLISPDLHRTPRLTYAASSSPDSHPSASAPRTEVRYRILGMGTPVAGSSASPASLSRLSHEPVTHQISPSNGTSSSMSNPRGPRNAYDILLSTRGFDDIDGLPQSKVHEWARRDASDDSQITTSSIGSGGDATARDIFEEGRVSVW